MGGRESTAGVVRRRVELNVFSARRFDVRGPRRGTYGVRVKTSRGPIEPARAADEPAIRALLAEAGLAADDLGAQLGHFFVARDATGNAIGVVGAEVHRPDALLRSLAVALAWRAAGVGSELVATLDRAGATWGVRRWWLLTTTAAAFFEARGFVRATRCDAPEAIRGTGQFRGGCAETAVCLTRACGG